LANFPSNESLDVLSDWEKDVNPLTAGIQFVLVDEQEVSALDPLWQKIAVQPRLNLVAVQDTVHVFEIR
jgi:hypothetical protein